MSQKKIIRVRTAPSPTGFAHVGTAYTSLFNYAFAKHNQGKFILRLEDTDVKRHVKGAEQAIYDGLSHLGITWDEGPDSGGSFGPYRQSERLEIYQKKAQELIEQGKAYEDEGAIRVKNPEKEVSWNDLVRGNISFPGDQITDFVILKSDGYPTYNFAVVMDDVTMEISHVIRGEEHISNTPRQLVLYQMLGAIPPYFAHHPTLRNESRKKLSKRRDPVNLKIYQEQGYLPEALLNFLMLMGWSHPEGKEIFSLDEFVKQFSLDRVLKSGPVFDMNKLDWLNGHYVRELSIESLNEKFKIQNTKFANLPKDTQIAITTLIRERIKKLSDIADFAGFFFEEPLVDKSLLGTNASVHLEVARDVIKNLEPWTNENINEKMLEAVKDSNFKTGDFFMDLRIAITGSKFTPPINESMIILGKAKSLERLN